MTKKPSIPRRNIVNWHYVRDDILKKKGGSASSTTPPTPIATPTPTTTVMAAPRLSAAAKASQLPTPPTQIPSLDLQSLPTFTSVFRFEDRVRLLEVNFSNIPGIVNQYMHQQMPEAVTPPKMRVAAEYCTGALLHN
nr:hypothetical protein [Tanacetum cinerariifolium]